MKILLLTDVPPCRNFTAGIVLDQLCRILPEGTVACFAVPFPELRFEISPELRNMPIRYATRPREAWDIPLPSRLQRMSSAVSFLAETWNGCFRVRQLASQAARFGREFGAEAVWCVLEGQTMIRLAVPVAESLRVPLFTQVWDPPQWWLRARRVDRVSSHRIIHCFGRAIRQSVACATASFAMADRYHQDYGTRTEALLPSLDPSMALPPAAAPHAGEEFVIGMAGQFYASEEWRALIVALDRARWKLGNRDVRIRVLARSFSASASAAARIEFLGWRSQQESIRLLSDTDVLYCPYWFSPQFRTEAELSFPSKLTTYFAAGRPVLFHGPTYASPARFIDEHRAGLCCHSTDAHDIINALTKICSAPQLYSQLTRAGREAFDEHLTLERLSEHFFSFLNCR